LDTYGNQLAATLLMQRWLPGAYAYTSDYIHNFTGGVGVAGTEQRRLMWALMAFSITPSGKIGSTGSQPALQVVKMATFDNNMRLINFGVINTCLFKNAQIPKAAEVVQNIWLNLTNAHGAFTNISCCFQVLQNDFDGGI
jgi:hypothetical protein